MEEVTYSRAVARRLLLQAADATREATGYVWSHGLVCGGEELGDMIQGILASVLAEDDEDLVEPLTAGAFVVATILACATGRENHEP